MDIQEANIKKECAVVTNTETVGVSPTFAIPIEKCRDNWAKLRNAYASAIKRHKNKKRGQTGTNKKPWKYEEWMSFLHLHMESRITKTNLTAPPESPIPDNSPGSPFSINESERSSGEHLLPSPLSLSSEELQRRLPLRRPIKSELKEIYDLMRTSKDLRRQRQSSKQNLDETDLFFMSMSKTMKALPHLDQTRIKLDLSTAVSEAEILNIQLRETT